MDRKQKNENIKQKTLEIKDKMRGNEIAQAVEKDFELYLHNLMESNSNSVYSNRSTSPDYHLQTDDVKQENHLKKLEFFVDNYNYR